MRNAFEWIGWIAAFLCLIDCIVLPILIAVSPLLGFHQIVHGVNDQLATLVVIGLCLVAFFPSFLKHRNLKVAALVALGISLVFFGNMLGESSDQALHVLLCFAGSACMIKANRLSRRLLATSCCEHH